MVGLWEQELQRPTVEQVQQRPACPQFLHCLLGGGQQVAGSCTAMLVWALELPQVGLWVVLVGEEPCQQMGLEGN